MANNWVDGRTWAVSEALTAAKMNEISSALNTIGDSPASYVPTVASGWTSNFTVTGTNQEVGQWTFFTIDVSFTGAPAGSGVVNITLPSTPSADHPFWSSFGTMSVRDTSASTVIGGTAVYSGGANITGFYSSAGARLSNAAPFTFASGDTLHMQGMYYRD